MKLRILTFVTLAAAWLPARAVENLNSFLPEDSAFFMAMRDSYLFENLEEHPMAKIVAQSELKKVFAPLMKTHIAGRERNEKLYKEETGMTLDELRKFFPGGTVAGMKFDFPRMLDDMAKGRGNPLHKSPFEYLDFVFAMAFSGDEALSEKLARAYGRAMKEAIEAAPSPPDAPKPASFPDDYDASTDEYAGVKLHLWKLKPGMKAPIESPCFALIDGTIVIGTSERGLKGALDRVKKGGASLADAPRFARMIKMARESDMLMCFDISAVVHPAMEKTPITRRHWVLTG